MEEQTFEEQTGISEEEFELDFVLALYMMQGYDYDIARELALQEINNSKD